MKRILVLLLVSMAGYCRAEVSFNMSTRDLRRGGRVVQNSRVSIHEQQVRMDILPSPEGKPVYSYIFNAREEKLRIVDHERRSYSVISRRDIESMGSAMSEVQRQASRLPDEQRQMLEGMLGRQIAPPEPEEPAAARLEIMDAEREVEGVNCRQAVLHFEDQRRLELWVADWRDVPAGSSTADMLASLDDFLRPARNLLDEGDAGSADILGRLEEMQGFPMAVREVGYDGPRRLTVISKLQEFAGDPSDFEIPDDYRLRELPAAELGGLGLP